MTKYRYIILICLLGWCTTIFAGGCFELTNYYYSRPTNYTTRGGENWMATGAAVEPTSSMYFYSPYEYVMLTGGNKNTAPGQLQVQIQPQKGVDTLTFLVAKPCISDYYSGAGVYVYADDTLVFAQLVTAYNLEYQQVCVPINQDCRAMTIAITNYYTNTTTAHNNRIAFAHFCWSDFQHSEQPDDPGHHEEPDDPEHPQPPIRPTEKADTVELAEVVCYDQIPYMWNGIACVKTDDYVYMTKSMGGRDSVTILHLIVSQQPTLRTEEIEMKVGDQLVWHKQKIKPLQVGDTILQDTLRDDTYGCIAAIYSLTIHVVAGLSKGTAWYYMCPGQSETINGHVFTAPSNHIGIWTQQWTDTLVGAARYGLDSICEVHVVVSSSAIDIQQDTTICIGESFTWHGETIDNAGIYVYTIPSQINPGCDSINYLLNVSYPTITSSYETYQICHTEVPFSWNGVEYTTSGTYTAHLTASSGCDSIAMLFLSVLPPPIEDHVKMSVCEGSYVFWHQRMYDRAGIYYDTIPYRYYQDGCDSAYCSLTLTLNSKSQRMDTIAICSSELPYNWNGRMLPQAGWYQEVGLNCWGCDSVSWLLLKVTDSEKVIENLQVCHNQLPYVWNGMTCTSAGEYTYHTTNQFGCDSIVELHLLEDDYASSDTVVWLCQSDVPFTWHGHTIFTSDTVQWTTTNSIGCDSIVTLYAHLIPEVIEIYDKDTVCAGNIVSWHNQLLTESGTYYDTIFSRTSARCDSVHYTYELTVLQPTDSVTHASICMGETYTWHGRTFHSSLDEREVLTNAAGCDSVCTLHLNVYPYTYGNQTAQICYGDSILIHDHWRKETGVYADTLRGASVFGCDSICRVKLQVLPQPRIDRVGIRLYPEELPYSWRGREYMMDGLYTDTITNSHTGCDSIYYQLDLHVLDACETKPRVQ